MVVLEANGGFLTECRKFPGLLVALTSPERAARGTALGEIMGETLHQGSVYEATVKVIPFLVKVLDHPNADRAELLALLYHYACAASEYYTQCEAALKEDDTDEDARVVVDTVNAVKAGLPTFTRLLEGPNESLREQATLLAAFGDRVAVRESLGAMIVRDTSARVRAVALQSLLALDGAEIRDAERFFDHPDAMTRLVAAICAGKRFGPKAHGAVDVLLAAFEGPENVRNAYEQLPFVDGDALADIVLAIGAIRSDKARGALSHLASRLDTVSALDAITYARGPFALAFGNGERPYATDFVVALETVARSRKFYEFVNCSDVLEDWNLPRGAAALAALAAEVKAAQDPEAIMHAKMHED